MRAIKRIVVLAIAALAFLAAWQVGTAELENYHLEQDMHELASNQSSFRFGNVARTDDDVRALLIRKAMADGIDLEPDQVTIQHPDDRPDAPLYLTAHYSVDVHVARYDFVLHFSPTSATNSF